MTRRSFWEWFDDLAGGIAVACIAGLVAGLVWLALQPRPDPHAGWTCLKTESQTSLTLIPSGKVMVPIQRTRDECVLWQKDKKP